MQKRQQWESASDADWGLAVEREAVIRPLAERHNLEQQSRYRRTLRIWADLFTLFDETDASTMERASRHWPATLQRRFASALRIRTRKRWPYNRFRYFTVCPGFKRSEAMIVRDLTAVNPP